MADPHGDLCFVRVYSGVLKSRSRPLNPRLGKKEMASQLWHIQADRREKLETDAVEAGEIVGITGIKDSATGDTLCEANHPIVLESIVFPEPVISMAVEPESSADRRKLAETLQMLSRQDPTFRATRQRRDGADDHQRHGGIAPGSDPPPHGARLQAERARPSSRSVSYRETIKKSQAAVGEFSRHAAGVTQFARVHLKLEPLAQSDTVVVKNDVKPGAAVPGILALIEQAVRDSAQGAGMLGLPADPGEDHDSGGRSDASWKTPKSPFRAAASDAVHQGVSDAGVAAARTDHEARSRHARRILGERAFRPDVAPGDDRRDRPARRPAGDRRRGAAGDDVRLFDARPQPVARPGLVFDGTAQVRRGPAGSAEGNDGGVE